MKRTFNPTHVYLFIEVTASIFFPMIWVAASLYQVTVAQLTPLQLVLIGTALEVSAFVFEIPTGVVADIYSRKLSIIIGYILMGIGFIYESLFPSFWPLILAQVIWGLGYTFTSGATEAWISDEIGEENANKLFLRATRWALYASLLGMALSALVGINNVAMPIFWGGFGLSLVGVALIFIMPETGFQPTPREDRNTWGQMVFTFKEGVHVVRSRPHLMTILGIGLFYGLYSEGFDRLWVKHIVDTFEIPALFYGSELVFLSVLRIIGTVLTIAALRPIEKRLDTSNPIVIGRAMFFITAAISLSLIAFAFAPTLNAIIIAFLFIWIFRRIAGPLYTAWVNKKLDSGTRATVISISSQVDTVGQIAGGPGVGLIAKLVSVVAALTTSGLLLTPALWLVAKANRQSHALDEENKT